MKDSLLKPFQTEKQGNKLLLTKTTMFDQPTDKLIVADVGQDHVEEVDIVTAGKNYGWHLKEGTFLFDPATGNVSADPSPDPARLYADDERHRRRDDEHDVR